MNILNNKIIFGAKVKVKLIFPIIVGIIGVIFSLLIPIYFKKLIDTISQGKGIEFYILSLIILLVIIQLILRIISDFWLQKIGILTVGELRKKIIIKIISFKKEYFDKSLSGDISSILVNDASALSYLLSTTIPSIITSLISSVVIISMLFYLSFKLSLVLVIIVPILIFIYLPLGRTLSKTSLQYQEELGILNHYSQFITNENHFIKISATEEVEVLKGNSVVNNLIGISLKQAKIYAITTPLLMTGTIFGALSLISYGLFLVHNHILTIGGFVAYITLFIQILDPLSSLGESFSHLKGIEGAAKRVLSILGVADEENKRGVEELDFNKIVFNNVQFTYANNKKILENISFSCKSGQSIAIVGPSGSGKTTLFSLIERLYPADSGKILIDDKEISELSLDTLRYNIGYVSQTYPIILGNIRENLIYGIRNRKFSDIELLEYSKLTNFYEVIMNLPQGLDTFVGDKGEFLSEGQKQRLAITRILLQKPKVLLMDEVTSALDSNSESIIQKTLEEIKENKIIITIAHRLSTIKNSDCILFLENGMITGKGTHNELYQTHVLYKSFVDNQIQKN